LQKYDFHHLQTQIPKVIEEKVRTFDFVTSRFASVVAAAAAAAAL
jgi:hypothetical protein